MNWHQVRSLEPKQVEPLVQWWARKLDIEWCQIEVRVLDQPFLTSETLGGQRCRALAEVHLLGAGLTRIRFGQRGLTHQTVLHEMIHVAQQDGIQSLLGLVGSRAARKVSAEIERHTAKLTKVIWRQLGPWALQEAARHAVCG